jgi:CRP/FNR family cyclic AMP-dependent transcriptional regulator
MQMLDYFGYVAAALVLLTFCMRSMRPLRIAALCSNIAFLVYGLGLGLAPVVALHLALLPINAFRLCQTLTTKERQDWVSSPSDRHAGIRMTK